MAVPAAIGGDVSLRQSYSWSGISAPYVAPLCRYMMGNGPWDNVAPEIAAFARKYRTPLILTRGSPERPTTGADDGRVWTVAELADKYDALGAELRQRKVKLYGLFDDAEYERTPEADERYYLACVRPLLNHYPDLLWANYATLPGTMLGDLQTALSPVLSMWTAGAEHTPASRKAWSLAQLDACLATGKPVVPWVPALSNADAAVTRDEWRDHLAAVGERVDTILLFDETRDGDESRGGKACRSDVTALARKLRKAA